MLKTRIIPCLDVAECRVVKGRNFVDLIDAGDPVEQARAYDAAGADEPVFPPQIHANAPRNHRGQRSYDPPPPAEATAHAR